MAEIDYEEVYGVEAPDPEDGLTGNEADGDGGQEQESGVPAALGAGNGDGGREAAEAETAAEETPEEQRDAGAQDRTEQAEEAGEPGDTAQSPEENARYAAVRRRAEEEARRNSAREVDALIAGSGLLNPYTEKPITSVEGLRAYQQQREAEEHRERMESLGMTEDQYRRYVEELPEVKEAREAAQRLQALEIRSRIEGDLREISKLDPTVKSLPDLAARPEYGEITALVERGYSLADAWKLQNFEALSRQTAEAARQETRNSLGGKQHLAATASRGEGAATVPAEVAEEYRQLVPDATDGEIQRHYDSYMKKTAG